jgi:hypothetical protein
MEPKKILKRHNIIDSPPTLLNRVLVSGIIEMARQIDNSNRTGYGNWMIMGSKSIELISKITYPETPLFNVYEEYYGTEEES